MKLYMCDNRLFFSFCETDSFKRYVRAAVQDELFWDQLLNDHRVARRATEEANRETKTYLSQHLNSLVHQQVVKELPNVVNDSHQTQQMLNKHQVQLNHSLQQESRAILNRIVNEDQYHEVNRHYFEAFNRRADQCLTNVNQRCEQTLTQLTREINRLDNYEQRLNYFNQKLNGTIIVGSGLVLTGLIYLICSATT